MNRGERAVPRTVPPSPPAYSTSGIGLKAEPLPARRVKGRKRPSIRPSNPLMMPQTAVSRAAATFVTARIAAFMPGASPPLVSTPMAT